MSRAGLLYGLSGLLFWVAASGCDRPLRSAPEEMPRPEADLMAAQDGATRTAVFAGGCFWCVEAVFEQLDGVIEVVSGYAGGTAETADYQLVSSGATAHAEVVRITYNPAKISYGQLLQVFFATHDPTTKDRQGPDWGKQYRSAIFFAEEEEKKVAEAYIKQLEEDKVFEKPIVTTLEPLGDGFFPAEEYHQDFVARNPNHPYVQRWAVPKVAKVHKDFKDLLKPSLKKAP